MTRLLLSFLICLIFVLSSFVITIVERLYQKFLLDNKTDFIPGVKVSWARVCRSHSESGLGLHDIQK